MPVSTSTRASVLDDVHVDRHQLALGEQLGHEDRRDGRRRHLASRALTLHGAWITHRGQLVPVSRSRRGCRP
jgi:hypothetical protein